MYSNYITNYQVFRPYCIEVSNILLDMVLLVVHAVLKLVVVLNLVVRLYYRVL